MRSRRSLPIAMISLAAAVIFFGSSKTGNSNQANHSNGTDVLSVFQISVLLPVLQLQLKQSLLHRPTMILLLIP